MESSLQDFFTANDGADKVTSAVAKRPSRDAGASKCRHAGEACDPKMMKNMQLFRHIADIQHAKYQQKYKASESLFFEVDKKKSKKRKRNRGGPQMTRRKAADSSSTSSSSSQS